VKKRKLAHDGRSCFYLFIKIATILYGLVTKCVIFCLPTSSKCNSFRARPDQELCSNRDIWRAHGIRFLVSNPRESRWCWICTNVVLHQQKTYKRRNKVHEFSCQQPVMNLRAYHTNPKPLLIWWLLSSRWYSVGHLLVRKYQVCFTMQFFLIHFIFEKEKICTTKRDTWKTRKHIHGCSKSFMRPHVV
jgi:hypothetical protein